MNKSLRRLLLATGASMGLVAASAISPALAATYNPPVDGGYVMRLVSPLPSAANSINLTADARGSWDQFYGKGLKAYSMYADVGGDVTITYKYTTAYGNPVTNATVYLIVNKRSSCSKTTFYTPQTTDYPGGNRNGDTHSIVRDWCGDQPQMGAGETAIIGTTDAFGKATYTLKNYNLTGEHFPKALNKENYYSIGVPCGDDNMCLQTTIAPSMTAHPSADYERGEDKDLLFLHFVNPKVTAVVASQYAKSGTAKKLTYKLTSLKNKPVKGKSVTFESWGEGDELKTWSVVSDAKGYVSITVTAKKGTSGLQVVRAHIYGAPKGTDSKIYWVK